jgi:PadR family transcriptional regulator PadR
MTATRLDLMHGTLDLLILRTLVAEPCHGWAIAERIQRLSRNVVRVDQRSLYEALHRLEEAGWITSECGAPGLGRRGHLFLLTAAGGEQLDEESAQWNTFSAAIARVMRLA